MDNTKPLVRKRWPLLNTTMFLQVFGPIVVVFIKCSSNIFGIRRTDLLSDCQEAQLLIEELGMLIMVLVGAALWLNVKSRNKKKGATGLLFLTALMHL